MALQTPYTNEQMLRLLALAHRHSNPNLLDNGYFPDPVNQRGVTNFSGGYGIDRWRASTTTVVTLTSNGLTVSDDTTVAHVYQPIHLKSLLGKAVTVSALTDSGVITATVTLPSESPSASKSIVSGEIKNNSYVSIYYNLSTDCIFVGLRRTTGAGPGLYIAAKLELGSEQTLAYQDDEGNWQLIDPPPNKQQELAKCQRFAFNPLTTAAYQVLGIATAVSTTQAIVSLALPATMRTATPALSVSDVTKLYLQSESYIPLTALSISSVSSSATKLAATVASGLTVGKSYALTTADQLPAFLISDDL